MRSSKRSATRAWFLPGVFATIIAAGCSTSTKTAATASTATSGGQTTLAPQTSPTRPPATVSRTTLTTLAQSTTSKATAPPTATATTQPPAPASCKAIVSNPTPGTGGSEIVSFTSNVPNGSVVATAHYKTPHSPQP